MASLPSLRREAAVAGSTLRDLKVEIIGFWMWMRAFHFVLKKPQHLWMKLSGDIVSVFNKRFLVKYYLILMISNRTLC